MCGRARCTLRVDDIPRACHRSGPPTRSIDTDRYRPAYNVSPGYNMAVVYRVNDGNVGGDDDGDGDCYAIHCMRWGLIPSFTKKSDKPDFFRMFNARSESVGEKASFRRLLPKNRCLVSAEGFYEWKKDGSKKQPYYIHFKDGRPLVFAALYDSWKNSEGELIYTFTILTTAPSSSLRWLHDRMPVILGDRGATDAWLDASSKLDILLKPYEDSDLVWYAVTPAMGKTSFDGPECIKEVHVKTEDKSTISKFFSRKVIKEEQEPNSEKKFKGNKEQKSDGEIKPEQDLEPDERRAADSSTNTNKVKVVKKEQGSEEEEADSKSNVAALPTNEEMLANSSVNTDECNKSHLSPSKCKTKQEMEDSGTEPELNPDEREKRLSSPARKKAKLKSDGDKQQPTLLSYFGKK